MLDCDQMSIYNFCLQEMRAKGIEGFNTHYINLVLKIRQNMNLIRSANNWVENGDLKGLKLW